MEVKYFFLVPNKSWVRMYEESIFNYTQRIFTGNKQAFGGIQIIYNYCDIINGNGKKAYVVNSSKWNSFNPKWFKTDTKAILKGEAKKKIKEEDIILIPECMYDEAKEYTTGKKILFVQNWSLYRDVEYEKYGYSGVLTVSEFCKKYIEERTKLPVFKVVNGINLALFKTNESLRRKNSVLFMSRKNGMDMQKAIQNLDKSVLEKIDLIEISGYYSQNALADVYRQSDIFVALGYPEGFSLPPLEAMACGCAVVGFSGGGGLEYMQNEENCIVVEDGDSIKLAEAIKKIVMDEELKEKIRENGEKKAKKFSIYRMKEELIDTLRALELI